MPNSTALCVVRRHANDFSMGRLQDLLQSTIPRAENAAVMIAQHKSPPSTTILLSESAVTIKFHMISRRSFSRLLRAGLNPPFGMAVSE